MARIFRWLLRTVTGVLLLAFLAACITYYLASRSLPDYNARLTVAGLSGPVEIVRDNANVPHIFGSTDEDVYFGLGFAHAQDRLWQITMARRAAQGRLSELFGVRTAKTDELLRRFGLYEAASASLSSLDAETRGALEAYSAGINAWINAVNEGALGRGAPEFFLFSREIAPWRPADTVAMGKVMALQLSGQLPQEVLRARVSLQLPEARLADILPDDPSSGTAALPDYASLVPIDGPQDGWTQFALDPLSPVKPPAFAGASNAWAAAPKRSAAGKSLLANDPHLELTAPTIWYLARIELETGGVIGATIPGIPFVLSGRSDALAWGITSAYLDDQDVFMMGGNGIGCTGHAQPPSFYSRGLEEAESAAAFAAENASPPPRSPGQPNWRICRCRLMPGCARVLTSQNLRSSPLRMRAVTSLRGMTSGGCAQRNSTCGFSSSRSSSNTAFSTRR